MLGHPLPAATNVSSAQPGGEKYTLRVRDVGTGKDVFEPIMVSVFFQK